MRGPKHYMDFEIEWDKLFAKILCMLGIHNYIANRQQYFSKTFGYTTGFYCKHCSKIQRTIKGKLVE